METVSSHLSLYLVANQQLILVLYFYSTKMAVKCVKNLLHHEPNCFLLLLSFIVLQLKGSIM